MKLIAYFLTLSACGVSSAVASICGAIELQGSAASRYIYSGKNVAKQTRQSPYTVNTYVHVVSPSSTAPIATQTLLEEQFRILNDAYQGNGFQFTMVSTNFTVNAKWQNFTAFSAAEQEMKSTLRQGTYAEINLYVVDSLAGGVAGYAYDPLEAPSDAAVIRDGVVMLAGTLPGGSEAPYNEGLAAVHEIGHWLGLYHPYRTGGCGESGDLVDDTPVQDTESRGCPVGKDSCPDQPGVDSIHNYMDYSDDSCRNEFTPGQVVRMTALYETRLAAVN